MEQGKEFHEERLAIGKAVAELRIKHGLSVRALSSMSGVAWQNITKLEHGRYNPSVDILNKLGRVLQFKLRLVSE